MPLQLPPPPPAVAVQAPTVVLIHGLGRTPRAMRPLEHAARARGYRVVNYGYPSRDADVAAHAARLAAHLRAEVPEGPLYVVTHSLGGILLRQAVATGALPAARVARAVMLAPPNQGSEIADALVAHEWTRRAAGAAMGPSLADLGTDTGSVVRRLPPVRFPLGVIAGTRTLNPVFSWIIPGADDGKVSVARAAVPGMAQLRLVPHSHGFLMRAPVVIAETFAFLERGRFDAPAAPPAAPPDSLAR
jgi:pimeloyl-ACP methyl ester carboxylesterase